MYTDISPDQRRFSESLAAYPRISCYWRSGRHGIELDIKALTAALGAMSPSEQILARFFMSVWLNDDSQEVSAVEAATLDDNERMLIAGWIAEPFWP